MFSPKKNMFYQNIYFLQKKTCFHKKKDQMGFKINQESKQKEGHGFDLGSCFFFSFSISSCFYQFLPNFPFFHPVNSSNLNPGVWH